MRVLNRFFERNKLEFELKNKVRKYYEMMKNENLSNSEKENRLIDKLSKTMKEEILVKANGKILHNFTLFRKFLSQKTMDKLILKLKRIRFSPEEYVFHVKKNIFSQNISFFRRAMRKLILVYIVLKRGKLYYAEIIVFLTLWKS